MTLASALLRPQRFQRPTGNAQWETVEVLLALLQKLLSDGVNGQHVSRKMAGILSAHVEELKTHVGKKAEQSSAKIQALFKPWLKEAETFKLPGTDFSTPQQIVDAVLLLLDRLDALLGSFSTDKLVKLLDDLWKLMENELGLSQAFLIDFMDKCFTDIIDALRKDYYIGPDKAIEVTDAVAGFEVSVRLDHLKSILTNAGKVKLFDRARVMDDLKTSCRQMKLDDTIGTIRDYLKALKTQIEAFEPMLDLPKLSSGVLPNLSFKNLPSPKTATKAPDGDQMSWYASWFFNEVKSVQDRFNIESEDGQQIAFRLIPQEVMEIVFGEILSFLTDAAEAALHFTSIEEKNKISPILNGSYKGAYSILTMAAYNHSGKDWVNAFNVIENKYIKLSFSSFLSLIGFLCEKTPSRGNSWLYGFLLSDLAGFLRQNGLVNQAREALCSFFTLLNTDLKSKPDSVNHEKVEGLTDLFAIGGAMLIARYDLFNMAVDQRQNYFWPSEKERGQFAARWISGSVATFLGGVVGTFFCTTLAWVAQEAKGDWEKCYPKGFWEEGFWEKDFEGDEPGFQIPRWIKLLVKSSYFWLSYHKTFWEGDTDGGKVGLNAENKVVSFKDGYPDYTSSPYKLPFTKGEAIQCIQGHLGFSDHNFITNYIYAVDFDFPENTEVLAMRGGTVVHYYDAAVDTDEGLINSITIRHDDPQEGSIPNPGHDRDHTGTVITYANYAYCRQNGVSDAFLKRGVPDTAIVGMKVKQGEVISTGTAREQLRVFVSSVEPDGDITQPWPREPKETTQPGAWTIPFVFRDVKNKSEDKNGIPLSLKYYLSENEKQPGVAATIANTSHQPAYKGGVASVSGENDIICWIELGEEASDQDDFYTGASILILTTENNQEVYQYCHITAYEGGSRKATIGGKWLVPPTKDSKIWIGGPPYQAATDSDKTFAYLSPLPDGLPPYTYPKMANYAKPVQSGNISSADSNFVICDTENVIDKVAEGFIGAHVVVYQDNIIIQYKKVRDCYSQENGNIKVEIEGAWDISPEELKDKYYEIGGLAYHGTPNSTYACLANDKYPESYSPTDFDDGRSPYLFQTYKANWQSNE